MQDWNSKDNFLREMDLRGNGQEEVGNNFLDTFKIPYSMNSNTDCISRTRESHWGEIVTIASCGRLSGTSRASSHWIISVTDSWSQSHSRWRPQPTDFKKGNAKMIKPVNLTDIELECDLVVAETNRQHRFWVELQLMMILVIDQLVNVFTGQQFNVSTLNQRTPCSLHHFPSWKIKTLAWNGTCQSDFQGIQGCYWNSHNVMFTFLSATMNWKKPQECTYSCHACDKHDRLSSVSLF